MTHRPTTPTPRLTHGAPAWRGGASRPAPPLASWTCVLWGRPHPPPSWTRTGSRGRVEGGAGVHGPPEPPARRRAYPELSPRRHCGPLEPGGTQGDSAPSRVQPTPLSPIQAKLEGAGIWNVRSRHYNSKDLLCPTLPLGMGDKGGARPVSEGVASRPAEGPYALGTPAHCQPQAWGRRIGWGKHPMS